MVLDITTNKEEIKMVNVTENKDYRFMQYDHYDGENYSFFDIIEVDAENETITVMLSCLGKLAMRTFELYEDENEDVFFEYGPCSERIYLEEFN